MTIGPFRKHDRLAEEKAEDKPNAQIDPAAPVKKLVAGDITEEGKVKQTEIKSGANKLVWGGFAAWTALCLFPVITGVGRKS